MAGIGELSVSVTARTQKATKNINTFRNAVGGLPSMVNRASRAMTGMATAAAGLAAVGVAAAGHQISKSMERIDEAAKSADKLGIAVDKLQALRFAAEETAGVAGGTFDTAMQRMVRRVSEARQGTGEAVGALQELGLNAANLAKLSPDQQFASIAEAMAGVSNQGDRVRLSMKLFDSEGVALVNTLKIGKAGLDQYADSAEKLGLTVSRFEAAQIERANDAFGRIGKSIEGVSNRLAIGLAPIIEEASKKFTEFGQIGVMSTKNIASGIRGVGSVVAAYTNVMDAGLRAFKQIRAYGYEFFAFLMRQFSNLSKVVADTLNKIPGVEMEPLEITATFADTLSNKAAELRKDADAHWKRPWPSEGVNKFFDDLDTRIAASKKKFDEAASMDTMKRNAEIMFGDSFQGLGKMVGSLAGSLTGGAQSLAGNMVNAMQSQPIKVEMAQTAQRGSREEFQLLRQMQNQEANRTAKQQQKQTTLQSKMAGGIEKLTSLFESNKGQMDRLITAIENIDLGEAV